MTDTLIASNVDRRLLLQQSKGLAEIFSFLTTGESSPRAEDWPDAIEGIQNLIAALLESPKLYAACIGTANGSSITLHRSRREALEAIADFLWNDDPGDEDEEGNPIQDDDELEQAIQDHCDTSADDYEVQEVDLP